MIIDQSDWGLISVSGADRVRFINGMCTGNIESLPVSKWLRVAMCDRKGRLLSVFDVVCRQDDLLLICERQLAQATVTELEKYAIADDVEFALVQLDVFRVWGSPRAVWTAPPVFASPPEPTASVEETEVRRIEAGFPKYGVDITDRNFPFETPIEHLIDYDKGCYIGQETIARVHARGDAQKKLRALLVQGEGAVPVGTGLRHAEFPSAGQVTSSAVSPDFGPIALAYVRRNVWDEGTCVQVGDREARVAMLPLGG